MLKKFTVSNYRSFEKPITLDFTNVGDYDFNDECIRDGLINKSIIYGENAVGKTNLGRAITDIVTMIPGLVSDVTLRQARLKAAGFINAKSNDKVARFEYIFKLDNTEITYIYEKYAVDKLYYESLKIDAELLYELNFSSGESDFSNFRNKPKLNSLNLDSLDERISVLKYILSHANLDKSSSLKKLERFIEGMRSPESVFEQMGIDNRASESIDYIIKKGHALKLENFLHEMGVDINLELVSIPGKGNTLYINYGTKKELLPFVEYASKGTLSLVELYPHIEIFKNSTFIYMDEFDANFHFRAAKLMFEKFKKNSNCQTIITTHNTDIMSNKYLRPDCYLLMFPDKMISLMDATDRKLRRGHNLEKLYQSGEFDELLDRIGDKNE